MICRIAKNAGVTTYMAKNNFLESANGIQKNTKELLERLSLTQSSVGELLVSVRHSESELLEKEEQKRKAREERERMERLREMLDSDQDHAAHAGGRDDDDLPPQQPAEKAETPVKQDDAAQPAAEKTEKPVETPAAEAAHEKAPAAEQAKPAQEAPAEAPKKPANSGYEAHPISQDDRRRPPQQQGDRAPRQDGYQQRPQGGNYPPRQDGYQQRPQQGGYTPRPQGGNYPPQQGGYQQRPQQGGYQQRPQGGNYPPQQGGYQQRPQQGGYTPRPQQGGTGPRPGQPGGFAPRGPRPAGAGAPPAPAAGSKERVSNYDPNKSAYARSKEADRKTKNKKAMSREAAPSATNWDDDSTGNRKLRRGQKQPMRRPEPVVIEKAVITTETITVKELSEKIGKPASEIIKKLFLLGMPTTINQEIDYDTCELVASDFGIELELKVAKTFEEVLTDSASGETDAEDQLKPRPPVVTIMGHVDHGKTSLLDAIRNSSVTEGEAGGITQHIGAYTVGCHGKPITFIDTPGHEAFTSMRARGAQVTDIVILVVAADDGIMPQTVEAINHAKAAGVPIIVAINKMDKPDANPDRVKQQLTEYELVSEEWGGQTIIVPVSAKKQEGLDTLLEMVLLQADVLELKANPDRLARGTIIEAKLDKGRGPLATVLVQNGTLRRGDTIVAGTAYGKVRAMTDDKGNTVNEAGPSTPVEVLGFSEVPDAGDILNVAEADKLSRQVVEERRDRIKAAQLKSKSKVSLDDLFTQLAADELKDLNIIVKADVQGSVEAVKQALEKLSNEEVRVRCIHGGVGAITGTDIMFASASNAIVIGFNVRPDTSARTMAEKENVDVRLYRVIYNAIDDVKAAMRGMFKPVFKEVELGRATVRETFKVTGVGTIAGAYVNDGKITRSAQIRVVRDSVVIHEGKISSLKRFKDDAKEVLTSFECGIGIDGFNDLQEGDVIEAFLMEEVKHA
ncbi:MAG: translation initiation factor IF-2 [Firmicutes bacterium HGW-Firmicutes-9]|jgi:translation initiation factor IF-2|nr:MAG: translation initiation factor IF-2 [Firmicutes bacterium HGW-Firmicutes-9]